MASKWKYKRLDQNEDEKEEEIVLIGNRSNDQINQQLNHLNDQLINQQTSLQINNLTDQSINSTNLFNTLNQHSSSNHQRNPFNPLGTFINQDLSADYRQSKYELKQRSNGFQSSTHNQQSTKDDSIELVHYSIKPNDSLLSIALSCNCTIEELKRINKLINDQEFYGLRYIKIPVRKFGLLSEILIHQLNQSNKSISLKEIKESLSNNQLDRLTIDNLTNGDHLSTDNSTNNLSSDHPNSQPLINFNYTDVDDTNQSTSSEIVTVINEKQNASSSSKSSSTNSLIVNVGLKKTFDFDKTDGDLNKFLVYLDKDLEKMRKLTNKQSNLSIIEPLDSNDIYLLNSVEQRNKSLDCDGDNCGLTFKSISFIAILICILIPLIYLAIYTEEQSSINHHLNHH